MTVESNLLEFDGMLQSDRANMTGTFSAGPMGDGKFTAKKK